MSVKNHFLYSFICSNVFLLFWLYPSTLYAQSPNSLSFATGYSLPLGKFASKQFSDPDAGLAGEGFFAQLAYERRLAERWGVRLSGSLNINQTNSQPIIEQYSVFLPDRNTYTWLSDVTQWRLGTLLIGPCGYLSVGAVELEGHVQGGVVLAEAPGIHLIGTSSTGQNAVEARIPVASTTAPGFGAGGAVRFRLTDHLRFQVTGNWTGANARLKNVPTYVKVGDRPAMEGLISPRRFVTVLNVGVGLAVVF
jgi:hypothetical protein